MTATTRINKPGVNNAGLTLIEMMLVVTVFAIATLAGIKVIKNRAVAGQINSVVTQMQNVAQGVVAYYMTNQNQWPTGPSLENLVTQSPSYFPAGTLCAPFTVGTTSPLCGSAAEIQGTAASGTFYFNLTLQTNSNDAAQAIASRLANATSSGNTVTMALTAPAQYFAGSGGFISPNQGWLVSAGLISLTPYSGHNNTTMGFWGTPVVLPNCPPNFEGHVIFAPQRYQTAQSLVNNGNDWGVHAVLSDPLPWVGVFDSNHNYIFATSIIDNPDAKGSAVQHLAYYMTFCLPAGHWGVSGYGKDTDSYWQQDWQCSSSWISFLTNGSSSYNSCNNVNQNMPNTPVGSPNAF